MASPERGVAQGAARDALEDRLARAALGAAAANAEPDGADWDGADDWDGAEQEEEVVEDMTEAELLSLLDAEADPLLVARTLLRDGWRARLQAAGATALSSAHVEALLARGWAVLEGACSAEACAAADEEASRRLQGGLLCDPGEMHASRDDPFRDSAARGDRLAFVPRAGDKGALSGALAALEALRGQAGLVFALRDGRAGDETQLAVYSGQGESYARHRDALPQPRHGDDTGLPPQRKLTAVLYLGECQEGGELRLYPSPEGGGGQQEIKPAAGRVALFFSGAVDHEVRPALSKRAALTLWMR